MDAGHAAAPSTGGGTALTRAFAIRTEASLVEGHRVVSIRARRGRGGAALRVRAGHRRRRRARALLLLLDAARATTTYSDENGGGFDQSGGPVAHTECATSSA